MNISETGIRKENGYYILDQAVNGLDVYARYSERTVHDVFLPLFKSWTELQRRENRRILVFLAAPPASGKSTLVNFLQLLSECTEGVEPLEAVGMDGFHHDQDYLLSHTIRRNGKEVPLVTIKGTPVTFDLPAFKERIERLKREAVCPWPLYDRTLHNPVEGKISVRGKVVLLEGNYILLDQDGWRDLKQYSDYSVRIRASCEDVRERLITRKMKNGISRREAEEFVDGSDILNVRLVNKYMLPADLTLQMTEDGDYRKVPEE